jgi:hypothetical protein
MRRIGRWVLNTLAVVSTILCVGTATLWIRGYWVGDRYIWARTGVQRGGGRELRSESGSFTFLQDTPASPRILSNSPHGGWEHGDPMWIAHTRDRMTFRVVGVDRELRFDPVTGATWNSGCVRLEILDKYLVALTASLPSIRLIVLARRRREKRRMGAAGRCSSCSYDLTGNVSGVCPECGMAITNP